MKTTSEKKKRPNLHQMVIEDQVWSDVKPILAEIGITRSTFVELLFKSLIASKAKPFAEVQGDLFGELTKAVVRKGKLKE